MSVEQFLNKLSVINFTLSYQSDLKAKRNKRVNQTREETAGKGPLRVLQTTGIVSVSRTGPSPRVWGRGGPALPARPLRAPCAFRARSVRARGHKGGHVVPGPGCHWAANENKGKGLITKKKKDPEFLYGELKSEEKIDYLL